ncbi:MAG: hypothetical protein ABEK01_01735 [Candidatus Nanohaloarchaea archaeon]
MKKQIDDEMLFRAWRHETGNHAQKIYGAEEVHGEENFSDFYREIRNSEEFDAGELEELLDHLDENEERLESLQEETGMRPHDAARNLYDITEAILDLNQGYRRGQSIPAGEATKVLGYHGLEPENRETPVEGNRSWRLPLNTVAKNCRDHGGPNLYLDEREDGEHYIVEMFDDGPGLAEDMEMDEIWEEGEYSSEYGNSGFGLNMACIAVEAMDGEIAAYREEDGELISSSPTGYGLDAEDLEGADLEDLGMGFVIGMPLYES